MPTRRATLAWATLSVCAALASAGNLTPPSGAPAPTMKTLHQVEPRTPIGPTTTPGSTVGGLVSGYTISQPGSYYLTGDVMVPNGTNGIIITATDVSIDLNGFRIVGASDSLAGIISPQSGASRISVRSGWVTGTAGGVLLGEAGNTVRDVTVSHIRGSGLVVGPGGLVDGCHATGCAAVGIGGGRGSVITRSTASGCVNGGIYAGADGVVITECAASNNQGPGYLLNGGALVSRSSATFNGSHGFSLSNRVTITDCHASGNTGAGIHVSGTDNRVEGNTALNNATGVQVAGAGNLVVRNTASGNTTQFSIANSNMNGVVVGSLAAMNSSTSHLINIAY